MNQSQRKDIFTLAGLRLAGAALFPRLGKSAESSFQALEKSGATKPNIICAYQENR